MTPNNYYITKMDKNILKSKSGQGLNSIRSETGCSEIKVAIFMKLSIDF